MITIKKQTAFGFFIITVFSLINNYPLPLNFIFLKCDVFSFTFYGLVSSRSRLTENLSRSDWFSRNLNVI